MIGSRWRIRDNGTWSGLECDFQPKCQFCGDGLACVNLKLFKFPLNEPAYFKHGEINGHAVDVTCKCPSCGFEKMFGVAVNKEDWGKLNQKAKDEYEQVVE